MTMTPVQTLITVLALALGTALTRALPPLLFPDGKKNPKIIDELTPLIPPAVIGLLVVYSLKSIDLSSAARWLPELIAISVTAAVHLWRRNMILTIAAGTLVYMLLIQFVFA